MKYTLAEGVDKTEENVQRGLLVSLPIIFAVLLLAFLGIHHPAKKPAPTGGKSSQTAKAKSSSSKGSTSATVASSTAITPTSAQTPSGNLQASSSFGAIGSSQPIIGGRGGGILPPPPSPTPTPPPLPPPPPAPPRVVCDNSGGQLPITCTICIPPVIVPAGHKALLKEDGTCIVIN